MCAVVGGVWLVGMAVEDVGDTGQRRRHLALLGMLCLALGAYCFGLVIA
jgi:hypothetical protein